KIHLRFSSRKGGPMQREVLGYALGSFGGWIHELVRRIEGLGGHLHGGMPVQQIVIKDGRAERLAFADGSEENFDSIIATVANKTFLRIAPDLPEDYLELCRGVPYQDALCLVLALEHSFSPVYWLNINDNSVPFLALVEHTNLIEKEQYGGKHILYISNYLDKESPLLQMTEAELWELYLPHLEKINPNFDPSWVSERWLYKASDAQPIFTVANAERIPPHRTPAQGLYLANMSQIYPEDRGQNYSIRLGEEIARLVIEDRERQPQYAV
ncbi:MAG TPA: FAD-dependent oxidoreductase, partial [Dehalococcoidia bacterium]|nr:FAD-dependent oxidoreductase [Dehalococcoidia bacterium]